MRRFGRRRSVMLSLAVAAATPAAARASNYVSTYLPTGSSTWNTAGNWSNSPAITAYPNNNPGNGNTFSAIIHGSGVGTTEASLATNISLGALSFSNADLIGTASNGSANQSTPAVISVSGAFDNSSGDGSVRLLRGIGLNLSGATTFNSSASTPVSLDGDPNTFLNIASGGVFTHNTPGTVTFYNPSVNVVGTLNVLQGSVVINNGLYQEGTLNVSSGASLTVAGALEYGATINDSGTAQLLGVAGQTGITGNINVGSGATLGFVPGGGSGFALNTYSHVTFGAGSSLNVAAGTGAILFGDDDTFNVSSVTLAAPVTFQNSGLILGTVNLTGTTATNIKFELNNTTTTGVSITTINQSGDTILTGQEVADAPTPVNVGTYNLSGGVAGGRIVVSTAFNWTGGVIGGNYGDVVVLPSSRLSISGNGGELAQNGRLDNEGGTFISYNSVALGNSSTGVAVFQQSSGTTVIHGVFGIGDDGTITGGGSGARGAVNVSGGTFYADEILGGNITGGFGSVAVSGSGIVTVAGGMNVGQTNVSGGSLTIQNSYGPPDEDPELYQTIAVGYQQSGSLAVSNGTLSTPYLKLGLTAGCTGTFNQTGGVVDISTTLGVADDGTGSVGSGIGIVTITGGTTTTTRLIAGSTAGGTGTVTVGGTGILFVTGSMTVMNGSSLSINSGGTVVLSPHGPAYNTSSAYSMTISPGGTLDITNCALDLPGAKLSTIVALVAQGYAGGNWTGTGITSSQASTDTEHLTGVAVISNNDGNGDPLYTPSLTTPPDPKKLGLFVGTDAGLNDVLVAYTYYGDANLDGKVDGSDYSLIDNGYAHHKTGWYNGDFNYDGVIDGTDYALMDNAYNNQGASLGPSALVAEVTSQVDVPASAVPEPTGVAALLAAAIAARRRNRRT